MVNRQGPYGGGWRKDGQFRKTQFRLKDSSSANAGRRLTPAELAEIAAEMGLPVSANRYQPETAPDRVKRVTAYEAAMKVEAEIRPKGSRVPESMWNKPLPKPRKRK